jgi:hypothetical protein
MITHVDESFVFNELSESYVLKLNVTKSKDWNLDLISALRDRNWLDAQTREITVSFATFNGEINVFSSVLFELEHAVGGYFISKTPRTHNVRAAVYEDELYGLEALWLFLVILNAITEFREMADAARENGGDCISYWKEDGWNYVDWLQIILAVTVSLFFFSIVYDTSTLVTEYSQGIDAGISELEPLNEHLDDILRNMSLYRGFALINLVVLLMRFFKAFRGQPRLAVITRTFVIAGVDISHFLLVYFSILFAFVASAVFLFGQHVNRYHDWAQACGWCFWSLTGEFFWQEVHEENPTMAIVWWWSFLLVMYLVLTNMLIAMILDAFNTANQEQTSKASMVAQILDIIKTSIDKKKNGISAEDLLEYLDDDDDDDDDDDNDDNDDNDDDEKNKVNDGTIDTGAKVVKSPEKQTSPVVKPEVVEEGRGTINRKRLSKIKLVSMSEIIDLWVSLQDSLTSTAQTATETFLIKQLRDFCLWNANDDKQMHDILEKNALAKLADMGIWFEPVQERVEFLVASIQMMTGSSSYDEDNQQESSVKQAKHHRLRNKAKKEKE